MRRVSYAEPVRRNPPGGKQETVQTISATVPHPVRLGPDHHSRGMTATGSHIDFEFAARSTTLQGKPLLRVGNCLLLHTPPVMLCSVTDRSGMTATGSHVHFHSLRGAQPPGKGYFSVPAGFCADLFRSIIGSRRIGACRRPYTATPGAFSRLQRPLPCPWSVNFLQIIRK